MKILLPIFIIIQIISLQWASAQQTVGLFQNSAESYNGYTLFAPLSYTETYLIDNCGKLIYSWSSSYKPGNSVYLTDDGYLLRTGCLNNTTFTSGGSGGIIEKIDKNNNIVWSYTISDTNQCQHHDIALLPNGNILAIVWDSYAEANAIANGRNPSTVSGSLWAEKIVEINPTNDSIVWEWYVWDHLIQDYSASQSNFGVLADHPELIDINFTNMAASEDWLHMNAIFYNVEFDQIAVSLHNTHEIWIIDHSTTTAEATGHSGGNYGKGGDLLYRWGNPQAYDCGTANDQMFFGQHDVRWIPNGYEGEGMIMVYNNGTNRPGGNYSTIDAFIPAVDSLGNYTMTPGSACPPTALSWQYIASNPTDIYSGSISGAERLSNGNTLICEGNSGHFFEVDSNGVIVWDYVSPVSIFGPMTQGDTPGGIPPSGRPNDVFRCKRYSADYSGLATYDLTPGDPIELNPIAYSCTIFSSINESYVEISKAFPNPASDYIIVENQRNTESIKKIEIFDINGKTMIEDCPDENSVRVNISSLNSGMYILRISLGKQTEFHQFIVE
ncbi:MAG: aryl-sulfate sulfotransferase [Bacteroidales bacterium]|nr:aryl-sulfate sulfotransferase [Bacteroidales bacterium]